MNAALPQSLSAILKTSNEASIIIDTRGVIVGVNKRAERLFGFKSSDLLDNNLSKLLCEPFASQHDEFIKKYLNTIDSNVIGE